jgi:hypothetical protein
MDEEGKLAVGTKVRFVDSFLARLTEKEEARLRGRVGTVTGYRMGANERIVLFEKVGRRPELKLFEVDLRRIEVVEE